MHVLLAALIILLLGLIVYVIWYLQQQFSTLNQQIGRRLKTISVTSHRQEDVLSEVNNPSNRERILKWLTRYPWVVGLNRKLLMSGKDIKVDEFLGVVSTIWLLSLLIFLVAGASFVIALLFATLLAMLPYGALNFVIRRRQDTLEEQLPDVLDFIARALQAGHSFSSAMQTAAMESPQPIAQEFMLASNQINFGESVHNALFGLTQRIECPDMNFFAVAVVINRETGGDLASLLKHVSEMIRARLQLHLSIHAMTAEARVSALILGLIPLILGMTLTAMQPKMMSVLVLDPAGRKLLIGSLLVMGFGVLWMRKLIHIRV